MPSYNLGRVRGNMWYAGDAMSGTNSTTGVIFRGSGIDAAFEGDMYLAASGNVYKCALPGSASVAKWVYVTNISGPVPEMVMNPAVDSSAKKALSAYGGNLLYSMIVAETARINQLMRLQDGSTTGDMELYDIRVMANGNTAATAGDAVRAQFNALSVGIGNLQALYETVIEKINENSGLIEEIDSALHDTNENLIGYEAGVMYFAGINRGERFVISTSDKVASYDQDVYLDAMRIDGSVISRYNMYRKVAEINTADEDIAYFKFEELPAVPWQVTIGIADVPYQEYHVSFERLKAQIDAVSLSLGTGSEQDTEEILNEIDSIKRDYVSKLDLPNVDVLSQIDEDDLATIKNGGSGSTPGGETTANVTMKDAAAGGVQLTVDGTTRTLAKQSDLSGKADKTDLNGYVGKNELENVDILSQITQGDLDAIREGDEDPVSVEMADAAAGGVQLTVDGTTRTLAKQSDLSGKADKTDLNGYVGKDELDNYELLSGIDAQRMAEWDAGGEGGTVDPLAGKKILFVGDSICYGVGLGSGQHPYPYWVGQLHPTATIVNDSVGGQTMSYQDPSSGQSLGQKCMDDRYSGAEYADADIIVIEGGINDMMRNKTFGTLKTLSDNIYQKFYKDEIQTYAGALEYIFKYFNQHFYGKRIVFTTIHRLADTSGVDKQWAYWECASEACAKWNVEFIDLYHSIPTELTGSQLHPNNATHKEWYARIIDDVLCGRRSFPISKDKTYYGKFIVGMSALIQKPNYTTNEFKVGDTFSQSNWRINSVGYNGAQGTNVTSKVTWDLSDIPMTSANVLTTEGTFFAHGWANIDGVFCACAVPVYVSQGDEPVPPTPEAELTGIGASKTKTEYNVGDTLNTDDIVVTGTYTDGSQRDLTSQATISTSGVNMGAEGTYTINISVDGGYNATINITVSAVAPPEPEEWDYVWNISTGGADYTGNSIKFDIPFDEVTLESGKNYVFECEYEIDIKHYDVVPNQYGQIRSRIIYSFNNSVSGIGGTTSFHQYDATTRNDEGILASNGWLYNSGTSRLGIIEGYSKQGFSKGSANTINKLNLSYGASAGSNVQMDVHIKNARVVEVA